MLMRMKWDAANRVTRDQVTPRYRLALPSLPSVTHLRSGVTESRDVDSHVSGTPVPTNQRPFSYIPIFIIIWIV